MPQVVNYTEARRKLKSLMDTVIEDRVAVVITRTTSEPVMMIAKSEFDALMETFQLLRSPRNAKRIRTALAEIDRRRCRRGKSGWRPRSTSNRE